MTVFAVTTERRVSCTTSSKWDPSLDLSDLEDRDKRPVSDCEKRLPGVQDCSAITSTFSDMGGASDQPSCSHDTIQRRKNARVPMMADRLRGSFSIAV